MSYNIGENVQVLSIPDHIPEGEYEIDGIYEVIARDGDSYEIATADESDAWLFKRSDLGYADG